MIRVWGAWTCWVTMPVISIAVDRWKMEKKHYHSQDASFRITNCVRSKSSKSQVLIYSNKNTRKSKLSIEDILRSSRMAKLSGLGEYINFFLKFIPWDQQQLAETRLYQTHFSPNYLVALFSQMANWQHSRQRYDPSSRPEYYRSKCFLHLLGKREVRQYPKNEYGLSVPRGYVQKDVALDEDQKVVPVRLHNLCRCLHYFYQIYDVPWE